MKTIFPGCSYDDILEMTNLPTLHDRRTTLCITYFNKMNRSNFFNHKLNALLPGRRTVPCALRASNGLPVRRERQSYVSRAGGDAGGQVSDGRTVLRQM